MIFYSMYFFMMVIVLLNLLIAMFSSTYDRVLQTSVTQWRYLMMVRSTACESNCATDNLLLLETPLSMLCLKMPQSTINQ